MVLFRSGLTAALAVFSVFGSILAVPLVDKLSGLSLGARDILKKSTPAPPHFVVYGDKFTPFPSAADLKGYTVYAMGFWLPSGPADMAQAWQQLSDSQHANYLKEYNDAGISLIVSAFGSTGAPTSQNDDPVTVANDLAAWVKQYGLQGVDVDYEDLKAFDGTSGTAEPWLISLTEQLRTNLPQGQYILTHVPLAPWFSPTQWSGGGYLQVDKAAGRLIDWYNIQFYNQGSTEYTTCDGLLTASSSNFPNTALFQIEQSGVDGNKLVIGKPATPSDAENGYMDTSTLHSCVVQARATGWNAGIMVWEVRFRSHVLPLWLDSYSLIPFGMDRGRPRQHYP